MRSVLSRSHDVHDRAPDQSGAASTPLGEPDVGESADVAVVVWPEVAQGRAGAMRLVAPLVSSTTLAVLPVDLTSDRLGLAEAGVGYVADPYHPVELLRRVEQAGEPGGRRRPTRWAGDTMLDEGARIVQRAGNPIDLTRKEFDLLAHLMRNQGMVQERSVLLQQVWSSTAYNPNVIEVTMSSLRHKLETHGPRILHTVRGIGYVCRIQRQQRDSLDVLRDQRAQLLRERQRLMDRRHGLVDQARSLRPEPIDDVRER